MSSRKEHRSDRHSSHRRDSSPRRRSRRDESSGEPPRRSEREMPPNFGADADRRDIDDNLNVLQRMSSITGPLELLKESMATGKELKIWTRNFKEIRGICTGKLLAFDKHWNLVLEGIEEIFLKKKKAKTPFMRELHTGDDIPDLPVKVPKTKKTNTATTSEEKTNSAETESTPVVAPAAAETEKSKVPGDGKKKKRRKKNKKSAVPFDRKYSLLFVRGDNIVMIAYKDE